MWGGDAEHTHEWHQELREGKSGGLSTKQLSTCYSCGAWLGSLGLEPTPDLYVEHIVEVFRHVRRVLRDNGTLWLNLGDSYAGSGNGAHDYRERDKNRSLSLHPDKYVGQSTRSLQRIGPQEHTEGHGRVWGYKPKDLMMMPFRVAMALQADGWWLRSVIPWLKRNSMPESVTDRPSTSVEYVFLLAKSARYYFDAEAVRAQAPRWTTKRPDGWDSGPGGHGTIHRNGRERGVNTHEERTTRNRRNSDWFFESWQGLLLDEQDEGLALVVNPQPFSGSHFATFPPKLVEPMVKASTRPGDTIVDPFAGAGTVGLVADRLGRNALLCELKDDYRAMAHDRLVKDAPLFAQVNGAS